MRRKKQMQQTGGGRMMGNMPDKYNLVVNTNHELVGQILATKTQKKKRAFNSTSFGFSKAITKPLER